MAAGCHFCLLAGNEKRPVRRNRVPTIRSVTVILSTIRGTSGAKSAAAKPVQSCGSRGSVERNLRGFSEFDCCPYRSRSAL
jgi:hypothetical protein